MTLKQKLKYGVIAVASAPMLAFADTPETAITSAQATILGYVATAGGAMVAVALAMVGWTVVAKFVKRIGSKA